MLGRRGDQFETDMIGRHVSAVDFRHEADVNAHFLSPKGREDRTDVKAMTDTAARLKILVMLRMDLILFTLFRECVTKRKGPAH